MFKDFNTLFAFLTVVTFASCTPDATPVPKQILASPVHFCGEQYDSETKSIKCLNGIQSLSPLKKMKKLKDIQLFLIPLADELDVPGPLAAFSELKQLERLEIFSVGRASLSPLEKLPMLRSLKLKTLSNNLSPIGKICPHLEELDIGLRNQADISFLSKCSHLKTLKIQSGTATRLPSLKGLVNLETLWIEMPNLQNIDELEKLTNLKKIVIIRTPLSDLTFFRSLKSIEKISFSLIPPTSIDILQMDYTPLLQIHDLQRIDFDSSHPTTESFRLVQQKFPNLKSGSNLRR